MQALSNLSILKKLLVAFAAMIVVSAGSNLLVWQKMSFIEQSSGWTEHTYQVLGLMQRVMGSMVDQETGVRGFLVSGDEKFLAPYTAGQGDFTAAFNEVKQATADNPQQQARLEELNRFARNWLGDVAEKEIALMRNADTREQARAMEASGAGKTSMDGIRGKVTEISQAERDLLTTRLAAQKEAFSGSRTTILVAGILGLLIAAAACFLLVQGISGPIMAMTEVMKRLAAGETKAEIPARGRKDEVGQMATTVQVFKDNMIETERLRADQAEAEKRAAAEKKSMMAKLAGDFEAAVGGIVKAVASAATEMQAAAKAMSGTAEETTQQATAVAAASEQASSNVQTVASAAEELSSSIGEIGRQVGQSTSIAGKAVDEASATNASVKALAGTAQKIGDVVKLINDIAGQTNLLALNATIEAARAGEAGKGFAVVASEVKSLASQTAKATEEIAAQVSAIQNATSDSVNRIDRIGQVIGEINQIATTIASAVEEQGAATKEIARNVQQAAAGTTEVSSNIAGVTKAAADTGTAATQVQASAADLARQGELLRAEVDKFLATIRAA